MEGLELSRHGQQEIQAELQNNNWTGKILDSFSSSRRINDIENASHELDISRLAQISLLPGGFLTDDARKKAWPTLLNTTSRSLDDASNLRAQTVCEHRDEAQVKLDVDRSFVYYPAEHDDQLESRRTELLNTIVTTLRKYPRLCYFQGYHDIVQVLLLVLGKESALVCVPSLSILRIRDFMLPVLSPSFAHLQLVPAIVLAVDPDLARRLAPAQPFFALSSALTMFAHEIEDYQKIARLFDFLLAHEASLSMYLFASIILSRRDELFGIEPDDPDMLHFVLSKLPKTINLDRLIEQAMSIFQAHPPEKLPLRAWAKVSSYSALRSTRSIQGNGVVSMQEIQDGLKYFDKQAQQVARQAMRKRLQSILWQNRRTIGGVGLAILVGLLSIWLQRSESNFWSLVTKRMTSISKLLASRIYGR